MSDRVVRRRVLGLAVLAWGLAVTPALAQAAASAAPAQVFTLDQAIQYAADHYPAVRAAIEQVNASAAGVTIARGAYWPRLDSLWQSNRATANNIFGQILPQSVIPSMTGPVLPTSSSQSVWSSATGALLSWEPFDFGLRSAQVSGAEAAVAQARAGEVLTRLEVESAVGQAFLAVVAAERGVAVAQADFDRRDVLARAVHTLVDNQLRPGAEASRADAERAAAATRLIQARQTQTVALSALGRILAVTSGQVGIDTATLLDAPPASDIASAPAADHPLAQVRQAAIAGASAQEQILSRTDFPRVFVQSSVFARGSGANPSGEFDGSAGGLALDRANWAAGVQIVFPNLFDFATLGARKAAAAASERAERARYDEALLTIASDQQTAAAMVQAARAVAANTPVELGAARQSELQARARYQAGLATIVEVADAQSLLAQAEAQDALARVDVWRALLAASVAQGSVTPFLGLLHPAAGVR